VLYDFVLVQDLIEDSQRASAIDHEILGYDLEPIDNGFAAQYVMIVLGPQSDSDAVLGKIVKSVGWHQISVHLNEGGPAKLTGPPNSHGRTSSVRNYYRDRLSCGGLDPSVAQPPLPLQSFLPLQPLSLDLQPPLPLQEFWPLQACFSFTLFWS